MNRIYLSVFAILLLFTYASAQKNEIKEAQKELKAGNSERALALLSPIEYLISNADDQDKVLFYYVQGTALVKQVNNHVGASKNISKAILAFSDLIQVESESKEKKFSFEAIKALHKIKENLVLSANDDYVKSEFVASSSKFYQAYLIDTRDTLQLYNAAISYKNSDDLDNALKCFEKLKTIKYSGNTFIYTAYSKKLLIDEYFLTLEERNLKIKNGTHLKPSESIISKKGEIYKNIALIYVQKGFKEKALKAIDEAKKYNGLDQSLALVEANLYLETKDYETFDKLASNILELDPKNAQLASNFGMKCEKELYFDGAEFYYKKGIVMNSLFEDNYINLSALLIHKINIIDSNIKNLGTSEENKKMISDLNFQKDVIFKSIPSYLQKVVSIDPFNSDAKQLMASINMVSNVKSRAFVSGE